MTIYLINFIDDEYDHIESVGYKTREEAEKYIESRESEKEFHKNKVKEIEDAMIYDCDECETCKQKQLCNQLSYHRSFVNDGFFMIKEIRVD